MNEVLPCPFCGGEAKLHESLYYEAPDCGGERIPENDEYYIECKKCGFCRLPEWGTVSYESASLAIKAWNKRIPLIAVPGVKEMVAAAYREGYDTGMGDGPDYPDNPEYEAKYLNNAVYEYMKALEAGNE